MLDALVESSHSGRRTVLQYIKMLSVVALPVAAVIGLVSYNLHTAVADAPTTRDLRIGRFAFESNTNRIGSNDSNSNRISNRIGRIYSLTVNTVTQ